VEIKLIPGTKGFKANKNGQIIGPNGQIRNQYTNGDGYLTASVLLENGKWRTFGVHRLVALAYIPYKGDLKYLTVNHIDYDIKNNKQQNLEWVSNKLNNIHAVLMRGTRNTPSIIAKSPDGKFEFISNIQVLSKRFGIDIDLAWNYIKNSTLMNDWLFTYCGSRTIIPKELCKNNFTSIRNNGRFVARMIDVKNIETQEIFNFNSFLEASQFFNTSVSHIFQCICKNAEKKLFKKKYVIVEKGNNFPYISQEEYENLLSPGGKHVLAYNVETKTIACYISASSFIKENKLSKKAVTTDLKNNRLRLLNNWWYTYMKSHNIKHLQALIDVQVNKS
jgi:hypothetical protein